MTGMTIAAATTWVKARTSRVAVVACPVEMGPQNDTTVRNTVTATNVRAGRFAHRARATARTTPMAVQPRVLTANPLIGMARPTASVLGAARMGTSAALAATAT